MLTEAQQEQFTRRWTESQPIVSRYVRSLVADSWAVRDIVQSTSLALLRKYAEYDESQPFLPWALGIAKFEILGHRRDQVRNRLVFDSDFLDRYTQSWAEVAERIAGEADALEQCVSRLPDRQRRILRLRYVEELGSDAIAARINLTAANVRTILKRTREALRQCVETRLQAEGGTT